MSSHKKAIAIFEPFSSGLLLAEEGKKQGFHVIGVCAQPRQTYVQLHLTEELLSKHCDTTIFEQDEEKVLEKLKTFPLPVIACIAGTDSGVELAEKAASFLNLSHVFESIVEARRDKGLMREVLQKSSLACPDFAVCKTKEELKAFAATHSFPLVVKTPKGAGADLVFICPDLASLEKRFEQIIETESVFGLSTTQAVVEEYIQGKEYVVDLFSFKDKHVVTDVLVYEKIAVSDELFLYSRVSSIPLEDSSIQTIVEYAKKIPSLFHITRGASHIEIKDDPEKGPTLIEIGARLGGSFIPYLVRRYSNFDPFRATIEAFTQKNMEIPKQIDYKKQMAILFFPIAQEGIIAQFLGVEEIKKLSSFDEISLRFKEGDNISATTQAFNAPCQALFAHVDAIQLQKDMDKAHKLFCIEFTDGRKSTLPSGPIV